MFDIKKFLGGFAFWKAEKFGKLVYNLIIIAICLGVFYVMFVKRTEVKKTTQKADTIENITISQTESAFELQLIPPKVQIGGFKLKLFK